MSACTVKFSAPVSEYTVEIGISTSHSIAQVYHLLVEQGLVGYQIVVGQRLARGSTAPFPLEQLAGQSKLELQLSSLEELGLSFPGKPALVENQVGSYRPALEAIIQVKRRAKEATRQPLTAEQWLQNLNFLACLRREKQILEEMVATTEL